MWVAFPWMVRLGAIVIFWERLSARRDVVGKELERCDRVRLYLMRTSSELEFFPRCYILQYKP